MSVRHSVERFPLLFHPLTLLQMRKGRDATTSTMVGALELLHLFLLTLQEVYEVENVEEEGLDAKEKASAETAADANITATSFKSEPLSSLDESHNSIYCEQDIRELIAIPRGRELQSKTYLVSAYIGLEATGSNRSLNLDLSHIE